MQISRKLFEELNNAEKKLIESNHFFSSINFSNLWSSIKGVPVWWVAEENSSIQILSGIEFKKSKLKRFQSMTDGTYCNPISNNSDPNKILLASLQDEITNYGYSKIDIVDYYKKLPSNERFNKQEFSTILVDISNPKWEPPDKKIASEIRKANRESVQINLFDPEKHFDKFL